MPIAQGPMESQVWYLKDDPKWEKEKPYYSNIPFEHPDAKQTNLETEPSNVSVVDIRGREGEFDLEQHGFCVVRTDLDDIDNIYPNFADPCWVQDNYYARLEKWMRAAIGDDKIRRIYIYDHTVRRRDPGLAVESRGTEGALQPVLAAHTDHSHGSGPTRIHAHLSEEEAKSLMQTRFQIINVWQPLFGPLEDWPLGICDPKSVRQEDLVHTDLIYPHYFGEIYSLRLNASHSWFYLSHQMPNELLLFKNYDSKLDSPTRFTPHCGIRNPMTPETARPRESIEFRVMVFYNEE
ncbi:hypothetical protein V8C35DRAFT_318437 [Trichoderma chlorosporum]